MQQMGTPSRSHWTAGFDSPNRVIGGGEGDIVVRAHGLGKAKAPEGVFASMSFAFTTDTELVQGGELGPRCRLPGLGT